MNRYDYHFRTLPAHLQSIPAQKVGYASGALFAHRANGFGADNDEAIVRQFDLGGMAEFWEIQLAEPMACVDFTRLLARHLYKLDWRSGLSEQEQRKLGPAAERINDSVKAGIRQALRAARRYGEPWFTVIPDPPPSNKLDRKARMGFVSSDTVIVPPDPPADGIDLNKLRVQPRAAAEWMLGSAMRRHLVPPSLVAFLCPEPVQTAPLKQGRPEGTSFSKADRVLAARMNFMVTAGDASSPTAAAWDLIGRDGSGARGKGTPEAKVKRLVGVAKALRETQNKAD